jgi:hypothetical protein
MLCPGPAGFSYDGLTQSRKAAKLQSRKERQRLFLAIKAVSFFAPLRLCVKPVFAVPMPWWRLPFFALLARAFLSLCERL